METIQCSKCGAVFEKTGAKDKLRRFKDKRFMTTFHCPNCDTRVVLKRNEEPTTLYLKRLERLKEQARRLGDRQEVNELQEEIDQIHREIKMNAEKTKDKKFSVKGRDKGHNPAEDANVLNAKMIVSVSKAKEMMLKMYPKAILYNISEEEINWKENGDLVGQYDVPTTTLYYRFKNSKDSYDPTKPKNIAAAKALSKNDPVIKHQIAIAKKTLKMPDAMAGVMGGMTKAEAKEILKKYGVSEDTAYDPTKPKNIAAAKALSKAQGIAASDEEGYDPLDPENIAKEKELAKARGAAATDVKIGNTEIENISDRELIKLAKANNIKVGENTISLSSIERERIIKELVGDSKTTDSLFKGQKVTAIKSEQGLREGETYTVLGEEKIIKQIVGEGDKIVYKLQDSSGNIIVIGNPDGLFYEVKDSLIPLRQNMSSKEVEYKVGGQWKPIEGKVKAAYENEQIKYDRADGGYHYYTCEVKDVGIDRDKYMRTKREFEEELIEATKKNDIAGIKAAKNGLEDNEKDWEESVQANKVKDAPSESERIKRDFEAGQKDHNGGYYDKWYRYNRSDNGKAYDEGFNSVAGKPVQIIEVMHDSKTKDSLFKGQKVTAIKSEQGLREGETYTVLGQEEIYNQIVGEENGCVYKLQDSSGNVVVVESPKGLFYEVKDAVNYMGERSFQTYEAWKRACKEINPNVQFEGNKDICQAKPGIGEWDGAEGIIYNTKTKNEDVMKQKVRDGNSYNMAVEYELFTYYNIPRSQARRIVERNSQELQKKEDANITIHNAADMLVHKEGLKGFEKIYVQFDSKVKDAKNSMGERSFQTYEAWKRACKQINPNVIFEGDKDICQAKPGIGEWDGAEGIIYNTKTKDEVGIGRYKGFEMYQTGSNLFSATNYSSSIVPSASFSAPSIEELKNKIDQHIDRVGKGIMTGNYDDQEENEKLKVKIGDIKKNMDAARKMGFDTAPYQKEIDKLECGDEERDQTGAETQEIAKNYRKLNRGFAEYDPEFAKAYFKNKKKTKDGEDQLIGNYEGYKIVFNGGFIKAQEDGFTKIEFPSSMGVGGWSRADVQKMFQKIDMKESGKDSKTRDKQQVIETYKDIDIIYDDVQGRYWAMYYGRVLSIKDIDISRLKRKIDDYLSGIKDSKTKDGSLDEIIRNMAREKADVPHNDDGTIRTPQQAQLAYEQWYKIIKSRYKNDSRYSAEYGDSKTKDRKSKDSRDKLIERYKGVDVFFDHTDSLYWAIPKGGVGLNGRSISEIHSKIDQFRDDQNAGDSKVKDAGLNKRGFTPKPHFMPNGDLIDEYGNKIGHYENTSSPEAREAYKKVIRALVAKNPEDSWLLKSIGDSKTKDAIIECMECGKKFKKNLTSSTFEVKCPNCGGYDVDVISGDSSDVYTKDPLTKKGQKILEAMKKIYGEEKGEQIFYASKNKGTIENVDKNTSDSLSDMDKKQLALGKKFKIVLPSGMGEPLYTNSFSGAVEMSKEYGKGTTVVDLTKVTDSKTKDAELTVPELKNKALTKVLRDFYEGVKEIYSPASVAGAQKLTQMIESETDPIKLKRWAGLDSKTKDDYKRMKLADLLKKAKEGYFELQSDPKPRNHVEIKYPNGKKEWVFVEDQEIKIIIGEDPKVPSPAEQKVESNDVIYKEYTLKQLPETGEFEIYAPGGSIVGHAKALELAKLFVDRVVASKVSDAQSKDAMNESQVRSLCKQAGKEYLADNPDGDLDQVAGDIAEGIAYSNPQVLDFLKKEFGGSVTRRQAREYLADLI